MTVFETWIGHVRHAARSLWHRPSFTVIGILTLGIGIGANTAIFSVINAVLLKPLPYRAPERLVMVWRTAPLEGVLEGFTSYPDYRDWREQSSSFDDLAAFWTFANGDVNLTGGAEPERVPVARVMSNYFATLGAVPLHGRAFLPEENVVGNHRRAILSYGLWQRQFGGDPSIVGRPVTVNGFPYTVVGIMPAAFRPLSTLALKNDVTLWRPLAPDDNQTGGRASRNLRVVGRLAEGVTLEQAQAEMDGIAARLAAAYPETNRDSGVRLVPVRDQVVREARVALLFLFGAVGLVLLGACVNVANLMLVKSAGRRKQVAVQLAVGATRTHVIARVLVEALMLGVAGAAVGIGLAYGGMRALLALGPRDLPLLADVRIDGPVLLFTALTAGATGLLFGIIPAWRTSTLDLAAFLREGGRRSSGRGDRRLTSSLVVIAMALATLLLVASGLLVRSFQALLRVEPGLNPANVLTLQVELPMATTYPRQADRDRFFADLLAEVRALPDVVDASMASGPPIEEQISDLAFSVPGRDDDPSLRANFRMVSPGYFSMLEVPRLDGRAFEDNDDRSAPRVVVVSRSLASFVWGDASPLGQRMSLPFGADAEVIGVVGDVRTGGLDGERTRTVYLPAAQWGFNFMTVLAKGRETPLAIAPQVRRIVRDMDDQLPVYNVRTMDDLMARSVEQQRFQMLLIATFSILALALAVMGTYGVVSYSVSDRTNELGLRMALGANARAIRVLVVRQGIVLALAGVTIGSLAAMMFGGVTSRFLFNVNPRDWVTLTITPVVLIVASLLATYVPARRGTRVDPLLALRDE